MSNLPASATPSADPAPIVAARVEPAEGAFPMHRSWKIALIVAVVMVLLALMGVGLTTAKSAAASVYWVSLVPLYGILCVWVAWVRRVPGGPFGMGEASRQILHWLGIGIALGLDFFIRRTGEE